MGNTVGRDSPSRQTSVASAASAVSAVSPVGRSKTFKERLQHVLAINTETDKESDDECCDDDGSGSGGSSSDDSITQKHKVLFGEKTYVFTNYGPIKIHKLFKLEKCIKSQLEIFDGETFHKLPKIYKVKVDSEVTKLNTEEGQALLCSANCIAEKSAFVGCCSRADNREQQVNSRQYGIVQASKYKRFGKVKNLDVLFIKNKIQLNEFLEGWASLFQGEVIGNYDAILDLYYICAFNNQYAKMEIEQNYCRLFISTHKPRNIEIQSCQTSLRSFMYGLDMSPSDKIFVNNFEVACK